MAAGPRSLPALSPRTCPRTCPRGGACRLAAPARPRPRRRQLARHHLSPRGPPLSSPARSGRSAQCPRMPRPFPQPRRLRARAGASSGLGAPHPTHVPTLRGGPCGPSGSRVAAARWFVRRPVPPRCAGWVGVGFAFCRGEGAAKIGRAYLKIRYSEMRPALGPWLKWHLPSYPPIVSHPTPAPLPHACRPLPPPANPSGGRGDATPRSTLSVSAARHTAPHGRLGTAPPVTGFVVLYGLDITWSVVCIT